MRLSRFDVLHYDEAPAHMCWRCQNKAIYLDNQFTKSLYGGLVEVKARPLLDSTESIFKAKSQIILILSACAINCIQD